MADLTGQQLKNSYQNLVTIDATIESNPTSGQLENGLGNPITALGIGTDSPALDINASTKALSIYNNSNDGSGIGLESINTTFNLVAGNDSTFISNQTADPLIFRTDATERIRIYSGGDISFRDTGGSEAFYWDASEANLLLGLTTDAGVTDGLTIYKGSGTAGINLNANVYGADYSIVAGATGADAFGIYDNDASAYRMLIDSSGNVGINNTSPSSFLPNGNELVLGNGSASHGMTIFSDSAGTGNLFFADGTTGDEAYRGFLRYNHADDAMVIFTAGANERMRIDSSGNVGIGDVPKTQHSNVTDSLNVGSHLTFQRTKDTYIASNFYYNSSDAGISIASGWSPVYIQDVVNGKHQWLNATASATGADQTVSLQPLMTIDSSGNVGIGNTSPSSYGKTTIALGAVGGNVLALQKDSGAGIAFYGASFNNTGLLESQSANGDMVFYTGTSGVSEKFRIYAGGNVGITTGNLILDSGAGIDFSDTPNSSGTMTSELLDDYEEGTWTIGISFGGGTAGQTNNSNTGTYTKIGRQVTVNGFFRFTDKGTSTGNAKITGLPFTIGSTNIHYSTASLYFSNVSFANQFQAYGQVFSTEIFLEETTEAGAVTSLTDANFANNSNVTISITYFV